MNTKKDNFKEILIGILVLGFWMFGFVPSVAAAPGDITTVAGSATGGFSGDGGPATSASFNQPRGVFVDGSGNIYIVDHVNNRIRKVDTSADTITTVAGSGPTGVGGGAFFGDGTPATSARLKLPEGVFVDAEGNIYIADRDNARIRKVDMSGIISTVVGNGTKTFSGDGGPATSASLNFPRGVFVDGSGNIYIADTSNQRIRKVDASADTITTVAGNGTAGFSGDDGPATSASLNNPFSVFVDGSGNIYIGDASNHRIRKVDTSGSISTVAGNGIAGFSGDAGPATSASLNIPHGVFVDGLDNIYIVDLSNNRIRKVDTSGSISTVAGNGIAGFSGDAGPATSASLNIPHGVFVDGLDNIYIVDLSNNRIRKVDTSGSISTVAGNGIAGFSGDAGPATSASLNIPHGVFVDGLDNIYIVDLSNNRIRKVDTSGNINTVAGGGIARFSGDGGPATSASLNGPFGVFVDGLGNIYIGDNSNNRIRKVEGPAPNIAVNPSSVNFGSVPVGGSKPDTVTVNNTGGDTLTVSSFFTNPSFVASPIGPGFVLPGQSSKIEVRFQPGSVGVFNDSLTINSNDPDSSVVKVPLSGTGIAPNIAVNPLSINLDTVVVGGLKQDSLVISNTGNDTLRLGTVSKTGPNTAAFSFNPILPNLSGTAIVPGGNIKVIVNFSPGAVGPKSATLVIPSNDPDAAEDTVFVALTGVAVAPPVPNIAVNPDSVDFGTVQVGGSKSDTLMVSNTGTDTLNISTISTSPPFSALSIGPLAVVPGGSSKIEVKFQPTSGGGYLATV